MIGIENDIGKIEKQRNKINRNTDNRKVSKIDIPFKVRLLNKITN